MKGFIFTLGALLIAAAASAAPIGARNLQVSASSGYLGIEGAGEKWQGADICPALTLSLHPALAAHVSWDVGGARGRERASILRAQGQVRIFPLPTEQVSADRLDLSAGWLSMKGFDGLNAQLSASHFFSAHTFAFAMAGHCFSSDPAKADRDFYRAGLGIGTPLGR